MGASGSACCRIVVRICRLLTTLLDRTLNEVAGSATMAAASTSAAASFSPMGPERWTPASLVTHLNRTKDLAF